MNGDADIAAKVSIRAPARGATPDTGKPYYWTTVSIRAPARGATQDFTVSMRTRWFLSALPHGERQPGALLFAQYNQFLSALPHGERRLTVVGLPFISEFLSALPHGERPRRQAARARG